MAFSADLLPARVLEKASAIVHSGELYGQAAYFGVPQILVTDSSRETEFLSRNLMFAVESIAGPGGLDPSPPSNMIKATICNR